MSTAPPSLCLIGKNPQGPGNGGVTYVRLLARAAARAGFAPHVFCTGPRTETIASEVGEIHVVGTPWTRRRDVVWDAEVPFLTPWLLPALVQFAARAGGPVILHGVSLWGWAGLRASRRLQRMGIAAIPLVTAFDLKAEQAASALRGRLAGRGLLGTSLLSAGLGYAAEWAWERYGVWPIERYAYTRSRLVLINHASLRRLLVDAFGPSVPVRQIPCAPESAFLHSVTEPLDRGPAPPGLDGLDDPGAPLVVSVSRHDPHKGLDLFLQALARLRARGCRFRACLLSGGTLLHHHRRLAAELGLDRLTAFPGYVADPYPYLRHADAFVLPSRGECGSGSLSLLEAMQAGPAIVSSACHGIPEDVTDGVEALLVEPGQVDGLVSALTQVLADAGLRRRLAAAARARFARDFSADRLVQSLRDTYDEVICST